MHVFPFTLTLSKGLSVRFTCYTSVLCLLSANNAPVFQPPQAHLRTFYGENFVYQFLASDPEGSTVQFTLESGPKDAILSTAGMLMWKVTSASPQTLVLTVIDDCNAATRAVVEVQCENNIESLVQSISCGISCPFGKHDIALNLIYMLYELRFEHSACDNSYLCFKLYTLYT